MKRFAAHQFLVHSFQFIVSKLQNYKLQLQTVTTKGRNA